MYITSTSHATVDPVSLRPFEVRVDNTSSCPVFPDVTYCHLCANQSLIGCGNKESFVPVVDTFEKQSLLSDIFPIHSPAGWVTNAYLFAHLLGTVKSPMKIESNAA